MTGVQTCALPICKTVYQSHIRLLICIPFLHRQSPVYGPEEMHQSDVSWGKGEDMMMKAVVMEKIQGVVDGGHEMYSRR